MKAAPASDWLQPFSTAVITVTSFSDLPGLMEDEARLKHRVTCKVFTASKRAKQRPVLCIERQNQATKELILTLRELPGHSEGENFRIPLRLKSRPGFDGGIPKALNAFRA